MLAQLLLVADLGNPTFRKAFVQMRQLLAEKNWLELHESLLRILGSHELDRPQAEILHRDLVEAFTCSSRVARTRFNQDHLVRKMARTPVIDGTWELTEAGYPREATGWILHIRALYQTAIDFDASDEDKEYFQESYKNVLNTLGPTTMADFEKRAGVARSLRHAVMEVAEVIMDANAQIE